MKHLTNDVFGVKSRLIKSYIERQNVDTIFNNAIHDGNEVIVYGSSKQGKTSLILKHLKESQYVKVECSPQTRPIDIYKSVLRQLKINFVESYTETTSLEESGKIGAGVKIKVPFLGELGLNPEVSDKVSTSKQSKINYIEYNLTLAQDFSELLKVFNIDKYIVLENFHYLELDVQETLAYDFRVFQDNHIIFIILGIWREANRLVQYNGDLLDRISEVPVEPWQKADFMQVIKKGEGLLNVSFEEIVDDIINSAFDSIGVVQEICKHCCLIAGVEETQDKLFILKNTHLILALKKKSDEYGIRHIRNFESFVDILRKVSTQSGKASLAVPYYIIKILLITDAENIEKGLSRSYLLDEIRRIHHRPEDLRSSDLGAFLHNITQHQMSKKIQPPFLDYDRGGKILKVIDSSLYFYLRNCNRDEILGDLPNPFEEE